MATLQDIKDALAQGITDASEMRVFLDLRKAALVDAKRQDNVREEAFKFATYADYARLHIFNTKGGSGLSYFRTCQHCGANLDPGEKCNCEARLQEAEAPSYTPQCHNEPEPVREAV